MEAPIMSYQSDHHGRSLVGDRQERDALVRHRAELVQAHEQRRIDWAIDAALERGEELIMGEDGPELPAAYDDVPIKYAAVVPPPHWLESWRTPVTRSAGTPAPSRWWTAPTGPVHRALKPAGWRERRAALDAGYWPSWVRRHQPRPAPPRPYVDVRDAEQRRRKAAAEATIARPKRCRCDRPNFAHDVYLTDEAAVLQDGLDPASLPPIIEGGPTKQTVACLKCGHHINPFVATKPKRSRGGAGKTPQAALERIQQLKAAGLPLQAIADQLNADGLPTAKGGPWRKSSVGYLLRPVAAEA